MNIEETVAFSIQAGYSDLRVSEKKAADYILEHMKEVQKLSLAQLAKNSGVSQPTVIRMLKALGYSGFKQLKYAIVEEFAREGQCHNTQPLYGYPVLPEDTLADVPAKMAAAASAMIENCIRSISVKTYQEVIRKISKAERIDVYGVENSASACCDLVSKLLYLGLNCRYWSDPYLQRVSAASLTEKDVAIGISYTGTSRDTVDAVKTAGSQGACTIVITNFQNSPIGRYADHLICTTQEQLFYGNTIFSRTSQTLIVDMIYMGLLTQEYETCVQKLEKNSHVVRDKAYPLIKE